MNSRKPTPNKGLPPSDTKTNSVPFEISHYRDGQTIEVSPDDDRIYLVQSGTVQRFVELPGRKGPIPLELGKIEPGGYWHPLSALRHAANFRLGLQFKALGQAIVTKLEDESLLADKGKLLAILHSLADGSGRQVASAEATILHYAELAKKNEGASSEVGSLRVILEAEREELKEALASAQAKHAERARLADELRQVRSQTEAAMAGEIFLRAENKRLQAELKASHLARHADRLEAGAEVKRLEAELERYSEWIRTNFPDHPDVQDSRSVITTLDDVDAVIDRLFEESTIAYPPPKSAPQPPAPSHEEPFRFAKDEPKGFVEDEPSSGTRPTIPFDLPADHPPVKPVSVPPPSSVKGFEALCQTRSMGAVELPPQTQALSQTQEKPQPPAGWRDSLMEEALRDFLAEPKPEPEPASDPLPPISMPGSFALSTNDPARPRFDTLNFEDDTLPSAAPSKKAARQPPPPPSTPPRRNR